MTLLVDRIRNFESACEFLHKNAGILIGQLYDPSSELHNSMVGICEGNFSRILSDFGELTAKYPNWFEKSKMLSSCRSEFKRFISEISVLLEKDWDRVPNLHYALNDLWFEIENHLFEEAKKGSFDKNIPLNERVNKEKIDGFNFSGKSVDNISAIINTLTDSPHNSISDLINFKCPEIIAKGGNRNLKFEANLFRTIQAARNELVSGNYNPRSVGRNVKPELKSTPLSLVADNIVKIVRREVTNLPWSEVENYFLES